MKYYKDYNNFKNVVINKKISPSAFLNKDFYNWSLTNLELLQQYFIEDYPEANMEEEKYIILFYGFCEERYLKMLSIDSGVDEIDAIEEQKRRFKSD